MGPPWSGLFVERAVTPERRDDGGAYEERAFSAARTNPNGGVNVVVNAYTNSLSGGTPTRQYGIPPTVNAFLGNLGLELFTSFSGFKTACAVRDTSAGLAEGTTPGLFAIT